MAFLHEPERQPALRVPAVVAGLILVLVVAHVARTMASTLLSEEIIANYAFIPARYSHAFLTAHNVAPQTFWERAIPFVSYIFLHGSYTHLIVNCVWLLPFGSIVARRLGSVTFILFFLVCGAAGAAAHLVTNWGAYEPTIGASGAISGVMAMAFRIVALVEARDLPSYAATVSGDLRRHTPLAPILSSRIIVWSAVWLVINLVVGVTGLGAGPGSGPQVIAWQAHMGGYIAGLLLAGPFDALAFRISPPIPSA
ncbi:MAG TPA: rhomboid family intramembrane serine protease [Rhizomicrobium sp.]|nr:rhomboid family intramembrane serine protease [Rhizomicrobium sp.]